MSMPRSEERPAPPAPQPFDATGRHVYMIGIGGCGMAGLARMLRGRGAVVAGSDSTPSDSTAKLIAEGFAIDFDQSRPWLPEACDLVVASAAIKPDHPQVLEAERRGTRVLSYAEALGACMVGRTGVAIAGTHGKSTTTAMLGAVLVDAGLDPTVIVGATCPHLLSGCLGPPGPPTGFRLGADVIPAVGAAAGSPRPGLLVAEACEFNRSFHNYRPMVASISSVEADHLDVFGSLEAVIEAFHEFARLIPAAGEGGYLLIAHDGAHRKEVTAGLKCRVETIGFSPAADWVVTHDAATGEVSLRHRGRDVAAWVQRLPGAHNAINAATACALAVVLGAAPERAAASLAEFRGVDRRMQFLGERVVDGGRGAVRVYDDYGHHPTEVDSTLRALRAHERPDERGGRLICVFQPHQHSRTRHLLGEFAAAFASADVVIVPHIYFVRDSIQEKHKVSAADLVDRLRARGVRAMHLYPFEAIVEQLENLCRPGDVLVAMGAGPVWQVAQGYLRNAGAAAAAAGEEPARAVARSA